MLKPTIVLVLGLALAATAQEAAQPGGQPQVKLNYLNVCAPSAEEQTEIKKAFARAEAKPVFSHDFEVSRGLATLKDAPESKFVRLRRDFAADSPLMTAQYSISSDVDTTIETLALRTRDPKDFLELSLQDHVTAGAAPARALLKVDTPVNRIRVERMGKSSVVLARCEGADQSAYEPLFRRASEIMAQYRKALELGTAIRSELAWLSGSEPSRK